MPKRKNNNVAIITGATGQDGAYLSRHLLSQGIQVYGLLWRGRSSSFWRTDALGLTRKIRWVEGAWFDSGRLRRLLKTIQPDQVYNLAGFSSLAAAERDPENTRRLNGEWAEAWLDACRQERPQTRFFQASSREIFGLNNPKGCRLSEQSARHPQSAYARAKCVAMDAVQTYRDLYGLFAASGILFNHESPLRGPEFITRRLSQSVARIALGLEEGWTLQTLHSARDWSHAAEMAEAFPRILAAADPQDFVLASGRLTTLETLIKEAFAFFGLSWKTYTRVLRPTVGLEEPGQVTGDATKARRLLGWQARIRPEEFIREMVAADYERELAKNRHKL